LLGEVIFMQKKSKNRQRLGSFVPDPKIPHTGSSWLRASLLLYTKKTKTLSPFLELEVLFRLMCNHYFCLKKPGVSCWLSKLSKQTHRKKVKQKYALSQNQNKLTKTRSIWGSFKISFQFFYIVG